MNAEDMHLDETPTADEAAAVGEIADDSAHAEEELVPTWLAIVIVVLLLGLAVSAGYIIRQQFFEPESATIDQLEVMEWEARVDQDPSDVSARLSLGFAYQQAERYDEALAEYAFVLEVDPADTAALYNTGVIYQTLLRLSEAEAVLWDVLEVEPTHALAAKRLGEYYSGLGHYRSLMEAVGPAAEARPDMADLQLLMAIAHENLGDTQQAIDYYRRALVYAPDMTDARAGLERLGVDE